MNTKVKILGTKAEIHPSGPCALLIPHEDSEDGLTTQQSLDKMLDQNPWNLIIFAAVQAVEWDLDASHEGQSGPWRKIFSSLRERGRQKLSQVAQEIIRRDDRNAGATIEFRRKKPKGKRSCRRRKT